MKEKLYTIPVNEGFEAEDECPFCAMEREAERRAIRYYAGPGASYMEPDVRASTDRMGFCGCHMKKLYDYGNTLGNALMLQTYYAGLLGEMEAQLSDYELPAKKGLLRKKKPAPDLPYWKRLQQRVDACAICDKLGYNMERYYATFFMLVKDGAFREKVERSNGFCLRHLARLLELAETQLPSSQRQWFEKKLLPMTREHFIRVKQDLDWLVAKFDYRNASKPLGNSQTALPRAMQKLQGIYPAEAPYRKD